MCILNSNYLAEYKNAYKRELSQTWLKKIQSKKILIDNIKIIKLNSIKEKLETASFKIGFIGDYVGNVGRIIKVKNENYFVYNADLILKEDWDEIRKDEIILFKIASFFQNIDSKIIMYYISEKFEIKSIEISYIDSLVENLKRGYTFYNESDIGLLDKINNSKIIIIKRLSNLYFALLLKAKYKWGITNLNKIYLLNFFDPYLIEEMIDVSNLIEDLKAIG